MSVYGAIGFILRVVGCCVFVCERTGWIGLIFNDYDVTNFL